MGGPYSSTLLHAARVFLQEFIDGMRKNAMGGHQHQLYLSQYCCGKTKIYQAGPKGRGASEVVDENRPSEEEHDRVSSERVQ